MKQITIEIKGKKWKVKLLSDKVFNKHFGSDKLAVTCYNETDRFICFKRSHIDRSTITHELTHAYLSDMNLNGSKEEIEERFCDLIGNYFDKITDNFAEIYWQLCFSRDE